MIQSLVKNVYQRSWNSAHWSVAEEVQLVEVDKVIKKEPSRVLVTLPGGFIDDHSLHNVSDFYNSLHHTNP